MRKESRVILSQNTEGISKALKPYQARQEQLNRIVANLSQAEHPLKSVDEVAAALTQGLEAFVRGQLTEASSLQLVGGTRLSRSAVADLVDLPDLSEALAAETALKENHKVLSEAFGGGHLRYPGTATDGLEFHEGRFEISEAVKEKVISQCTTYSQCQEQTELLNAANELLKAINAFDIAFAPKPSQRAFHPLSDISNLFRYNPQTGAYELDRRVIINLFPPKEVERKSTETASVRV